MRVYKFLSVKYALKDINEHRIKISEFSDMNDPFELHGSKWSDPHKDSVISGSFARRGVLCFSSKWRNPLLWSHYADKHKGVCLGFDVPDDPAIVHTTQYFGDPEVLDVAPLETIRGEQIDYAEILVMRKLLVKFKDWSYEDEIRLFAALNERTGDLCYYAFDDRLTLREIIIGVRCTVSRSKLEKLLRGYSTPIYVLKARLSLESFQVEEESRWLHACG